MRATDLLADTGQSSGSRQTACHVRVITQEAKAKQRQQSSVRPLAPSLHTLPSHSGKMAPSFRPLCSRSSRRFPSTTARIGMEVAVAPGCRQHPITLPRRCGRQSAPLWETRRVQERTKLRTGTGRRTEPADGTSGVFSRTTAAARTMGCVGPWECAHRG